MTNRLARGVYFALQHLRGEPVSRAYRDVLSTEFVSRDELFAVQAQRQLTQLRFALKHVPYFRNALSGFADQIEKARSWEQVDRLMTALPVLEKETVLIRPEELTAENAGTLATHPDKTSGSSGTPLIFPCDKIAWSYRHALDFRCMRAFNVSVGERYALFFGLHWNKRSQMQTALRDLVFNRVRISAYAINPESVDQHRKSVERYRPRYFWGYPSAISDFCALLHDRSMDLRHLKLKAVFCTAEPLRPHQRLLIEECTGAKCVNLYGSAEGGLGATECPHGSLHLTSEVTWVQVREPGAVGGEAIVTDMMLRAFPLIRYAIGDEIVLKSGECTCGRPHPMLQSIEGRSGEPIVLPNGRRINSNLPSYIFKPLTPLKVIRRYRFIQTTDRDLELQIVANESFGAEHLRTVEREVRSAFGDDLEVPIRIVPRLADLPNAKHRDYVRLNN